MNPSVIILIGAPGAGKGTLSQWCKSQFNWDQLSTGNLCRKHISEQTEIGKAIDFAIKSGKLISDDIINTMVQEWFLRNQGISNTVILDGYPRTVEQATIFYNFFKTKIASLDLKIIWLKVVNQSNIMQRLLNRYICCNKECQTVYSSHVAQLGSKQVSVCDKCNSELIKRTDDEENSIKERLSSYFSYEKKLIDYYKSIGQNIHEFSGERPVDEVLNDFNKIVLAKNL